MVVLSPSYIYKWFIGLPNAYMLGTSKSLTAHEETTAGNQREKSKWTKLKLDIQILPDYTEPNNERVAKMAVTLTVQNATLEQYQCTAVADISLYDRQAGELVEQTQEERRFGGKHVVRFMMNLGWQERIERSANQHLEVGIKVKVQLRRISSEMADGFVSLVVK